MVPTVGIDKKFENKDAFAPIVVGNNVMIGMNSIIMTGVNIGDNVIIGAHSVGTKDVPENSIVAGVPAKTISSIQKFYESIANSNKTLAPTKLMTAEEKKEYLIKHHPEWFR